MVTKQIDSTWIQAVSHDDQTQTLTVAFKDGATFDYSGVSADTFNGLVAAESAGKYFSANIKGKFTAKRIA